MAKHKPTIVWGLRRLGKHPNGFVQTLDSKSLRIVYRHAPGHGFQIIDLPRADARLLIKRLQACLEETK